MKGIQLHLDLEVDPSREQELLEAYRREFEPAVRRQPGFSAVHLLHLSQELAGKAPEHCRYRLLICFDSETERQAWVASADHQRAWPRIEDTLTGQKYLALLYHAL